MKTSNIEPVKTQIVPHAFAAMLPLVSPAQPAEDGDLTGSNGANYLPVSLEAWLASRAALEIWPGGRGGKRRTSRAWKIMVARPAAA